jgi:ABC-2 type transport system permease protein
MPVMQITLYSLALSPDVKHLGLGVIDFANSPTSRNFVAALVQTQVFDLSPSGSTQQELAKKVRDGRLDAGVVILPDFDRCIKSGRRASVQVVLDGVDANTAGITSGYIVRAINAFTNQYDTGSQNPLQLVMPQTSFAYNPGLDAKWFFVPGVIALVLTLVSTMVSSAALVREKDLGTLEQLLMTPVNSAQILIAKIVPLSIVLMVNILVCVFLSVFIFHIPMRGSIWLFLFVSFLAILLGIAIGTALAAYSANQRQALLTSFFVNLPVIQLSGAITPLESMPPFWRQLSVLDPLRYYVSCVRGIMLKGSTLAIIWPEVSALAVFAIVLLALSAARFRKQLA